MSLPPRNGMAAVIITIAALFFTQLSVTATGQNLENTTNENISNKEVILVNGSNYKLLQGTAPILNDTQHKVLVEVFFWYGCPHCNDLEPSITAWANKQPKTVLVQRVPVAFNERLWIHSRLYYSLESMGRLDIHEKFFYAFHKENKHLVKEDEIFKWIAEQGINREQFTKIFKSFGIDSKVHIANKKVDTYKLDGVPAIVVNGKYLTSPAITGSNIMAINVLESLVEKVQLEITKKNISKK